MAKNFLQPGNVVTVTAPANFSSGEGALVGAGLFGVVGGDVLSGEDMDLHMVGVFDLAADTEDTFAIGDSVFWNATTKKCESAADSNSEATALIGVAVGAKGVGATTARVRLGVPAAIV